MKKTAYHCTDNIEGIKRDGKVIASRLTNVYLMGDLEGATNYLKEFRKKSIVMVEYDTKDVLRTWKPSYAIGSKVIKLKEGATANLLCSHQLGNISNQ